MPTEDPTKTYPGFKEPLLSHSQHAAPKSATKKKLSPIRPKSVSLGSAGTGGGLSKSIDGLNLKPSLIEQPGSHTVSGIAWQQQRKVVPLKTKRNSEGVLQGWSSIQRLGQPADIQSLMRSGHGVPTTSLSAIPHDSHKLDVTANSHDNPGSATSVEILQEMFTQSANTSPIGSKGSSPLGPSPQASNSHFRSSGAPAESFKTDAMMPQNHRRMQHSLPPHHAHGRSSSAKPPTKQEQLGHYTPELSNSMDYMGQRKAGYKRQQELPNLDDSKVLKNNRVEGTENGVDIKIP